MELDNPEAAMSNSNNNNSNNSNNNNNNNTNDNTIETNDVQTNGITSNRLKLGYEADVVRLIGQHLVSLGLKRTVDQLLKEANLVGLDHPLATELQKQILEGDFNKAKWLVHGITEHLSENQDAIKNKMKQLIAEQKFLELIEDDEPYKALICLRSELAPLMEDTNQIQHATALLMCKSVEEVRSKANWPGKLQSRQKLIEKIQRFIPPSMMLPPNRLSILLSQAAQLQREKCTLHMTNADDNIDLKLDHVCASDKFPLHCRQELDNHKTEIWFCKFSNDGKKLATAGLWGKIIIWDVDPDTKMLTERCTLSCGTHSITCLSWSPNDVFLLACGTEERSNLWIWNVLKEDIVNYISNSEDDSMTTCSWHLSGLKFAAASMKGNFNIYDLDGNRSGSREGVRVQCLSFLYKNPDIILAADSLNRIKSYSIRDMSLETDEEDILEEKHPIMSFTVDKEDKYIAVNLVEQGVHLWDLKLKTLLRMFPGVSQRNFMIYSSFSSPDATFLASGSEDGKVYIYHIHKDQPVAILHGHSRCVNCVSWNPKYPELLASVSDDRILRLWGPTQTEQVGRKNENEKDG